MKKLALLVLLLCAALLLRAADTPPTAVELAYWESLQRDIIELRTGILEANIREFPASASTEQLAPVARLIEDFRDRRDQDPIDQLGPDFLSYRTQLTELVDLALTPVTNALQFKSTVVLQVQDRMVAVMRNRTEVKAVEDYKPRLALFHQQLNTRVMAAGGPPRPFFQILGIGDKPRVASDLATPAERDARFLTESRSLHEILGELAEGHFIARRNELGVSHETTKNIFRQTTEAAAEALGQASVEELQSVLALRSPTAADGSFSIPQRLIRLELLKRADRVAYQLIMQEWQGALNRWSGESDDLAPLGVASDVAVMADGAWFAHAADSHTLVVRDPSGEVIRQERFDEPVRALTTLPSGELRVFTTAGVYEVFPTQPNTVAFLKVPRPNQFMQPRLAAAAAYDRTAFGLGVMPGAATGTTENTFAASNPSSRISAVGISADGRRLVYGYAGDRYLPGDTPMTGYFVMTFDQGKIDTAKPIVVQPGEALLRGPVTALSLGTTGDRIASTVNGRFGGVVSYHVFTPDSVDRKTIAIDDQLYSWIHLFDGPTPRIVAGTRHGVVRVWDVDSGDLLQRFTVPLGPEGVGFGILGDELISVSLGSPGVYRWNLADGKVLTTYDGPVPTVDLAELATRLQSERELRARLLPVLVTMLESPNDVREPHYEKLRGPLAEDVAGLGLTATVNQSYAADLHNRMATLYNNQRYGEAYAMGKPAIDAGLLEESLVTLTVQAGAADLYYGSKNDKLYAELIPLAERGAALYPTRLRLQTELHELRARQLTAARKIREALKEVDMIAQIEPGAALSSLRKFILLTGQVQARQSNNNRLAAQYMLEAIDYEPDDAQKASLAENAFALASNAKDWPTTLKAANIALHFKPALQKDESFMYWARHAYQQVNPR